MPILRAAPVAAPRRSASLAMQVSRNASCVGNPSLSKQNGAMNVTFAYLAAMNVTWRYAEDGGFGAGLNTPGWEDDPTSDAYVGFSA